MKKETSKKTTKKVVAKKIVAKKGIPRLSSIARDDKKKVVEKKVVEKKVAKIIATKAEVKVEAKKETAKPVVKLKTKRGSLVEKYQTHKQDTGSSEVQIALLSDKINELAKHLRKHHKDQDSKRGLLVAINKRRRLLNYLQKSNIKKYQKIIADLGLRK